jgi:hypothetical protein
MGVSTLYGVSNKAPGRKQRCEGRQSGIFVRMHAHTEGVCRIGDHSLLLERDVGSHRAARH